MRGEIGSIESMADVALGGKVLGQQDKIACRLKEIAMSLEEKLGGFVSIPAHGAVAKGICSDKNDLPNFFKLIGDMHDDISNTLCRIEGVIRNINL